PFLYGRQSLDSVIQRGILFGEAKTHQLMVRLRRIGVLIERGNRNNGDTVAYRQVLREVGFRLPGNRAVVGQQKERSRAWQRLEPRTGKAGGQPVALGLVERGQFR